MKRPQLARKLRAELAELHVEIRNRDHTIGRVERELAALSPRTAAVDHSRPLPRAGVDYAYGRPLPHNLGLAGVTKKRAAAPPAAQSRPAPGTWVPAAAAAGPWSSTYRLHHCLFFP